MENGNGNLDSPKMQDLMRKIRALKAKADDPSTTEAESLAFAAKVAQLLAQHNLDMAQLDVGKEDSDPLGHEDYVSNWNASPARRVLAMAVCKLYNVKPLIRQKPGQPWTLVGRKGNILMVKDMTEYLIKTTLRLANVWAKEQKNKMVLNEFANATDFKRGCFKRLSERLLDLYEQTAKAETPVYNGNNPGNLPALYANEAKLQRIYIDERWRTGTIRPQRIKQGYSAAAGRAAGDSISLHRQVGAGARSNYMIGKK